MSVMQGKNFDVSKVTMSSLRSLDNGGKMIFLNYGEGISPIYLQTPEMDIPFDPSYYADSDTSGKYSVKLSMKGMDDNKQLKTFHDKLCEFDELLKNKAMENSVAWFKKSKISMETIESLYNPQVKVSTDSETGEPNGKYPPSIQFKITKKDNKIQCQVYDNQKNVFNLDEGSDDSVDFSNILTKGAKVKAVLRCNGIWLANGKFGCTWRAEQICVKVPEGGLRDFAIMSDSDDEDSTEASEAPPPNLIDDSDDSDEEESAPVEPTPPKTTKKKVRKVNVKSSS